MRRAAPTFGREQLHALGGRLRQMRAEHGWSLKRLAGESGVSIAAIQKIEAGETNPSLVTVAAMTEALGASLDQVVSAARAQSRVIEVVHGRAEGSGKGELDVRDLSGDLFDPRLSIRLVTLPARSDLAAHKNPRTGPLFAYIVVGALRLAFPDKTTEDLRTGDSIHIKEDLPTAWSNPSERQSLILCVADRHVAA